jgi:hypothetical protein
MVQQVYGEVFVHVRWFQDGKEDITDNRTSGHPAILRTDPNVEKMK